MRRQFQKGSKAAAVLLLLLLVDVLISPSTAACNNSTASTSSISSRKLLAAVRGRMAYEDGSGTYIGSDGVSRSIGKKCWNDYFLVEMGRYWGDAQRASGPVNCAATSECQVSQMSGVEACESWSIEMSTGIQNQLLSASVTAGYSHETCNSAQDTTACTWADQGCHCIWSQQEFTYQHGYKRHRCNTGDGDYTVSMEDFVHNAPTSLVGYDCGRSCSDCS